MHVYTLCEWFSSSSSASDCDNQSVSDRVVSGMGTLFSLDHKFLTLLITTRLHENQISCKILC